MPKSLSNWKKELLGDRKPKTHTFSGDTESEAHIDLCW